MKIGTCYAQKDDENIQNIRVKRKFGKEREKQKGKGAFLKPLPLKMSFSSEN